ncbi:hypothetical protein J7E82_14470 [Arthrobacter sp. ISL-30]|nr:hypothetical protein [Arthrobacter sp. ISL-30]
MVIVAGVLLVSWGGPAASAFWSTASSTNFAAAQADALAAGPTPTTAVSAGSVTVSWTPGSTSAGRPATGYSIARYAAPTGGAKIPAAGSCSGTVSGLTCTDINVPTGTWYYTVTPSISLWQGPEGARSTATQVDTTPPAAPVINAPGYVNPSTMASVPVNGTAEAGSTVALTVTDAGAAHTLTQTITANASGNWTATPLNLTAFAAGPITYSATATDAFGNTGTAGSATTIKDVTSPTVTGVLLGNGPGNNIAGKIERGDFVTLTFSEALSANSICSAWTDNTTPQTQNGNGQVTVSISSTNVLTVTSTGCPALRVGNLALGASYYSSGPLTYKGNGSNGASALHWNPGARTLTITLGSQSTGSASTTVQSAASASYTPQAGLTDIAGNALGTTTTTGTASRF